MIQHKLQTKILLSVGCIILVMLATSTLLSMQVMKENYIEALELRSEALANELIQRILRFQSAPDIQPILESLSLVCIQYYESNYEKGVSHFAIINSAGEIAAHNDKNLWNVKIKSPELLRHLERKTVTSVLDGETYHCLIPVFGEQDNFLATVDVGFPESLIDEKTKAILLNSIILLLVFFVAAFWVVSVFVRKLITTPLAQLVAIVHNLSEGTLSQITPPQRSDEIGQLQRMIRGMVERWSNTIEEVQQSAEEVKTGTREINSSLTQLSEGASRQAATAEEISSSMEQISSTIRQNTENAMQAEQLAASSAESTESSGTTVTQAMKAMQAIAQKILVIEDIARQTRFLSLNATIESARAKDYGRGFAVVANEVRSLAERSRQAATEINKEASSSVDLAERADLMLQHLVPHISKTAKLIQEISTASREQDNGIQQITQAVMQLDQTIQQNAMLTGKSAVTAEHFAAQAERLQKAVAFFQLENSPPDNNGKDDKRDVS